MTVTGERRLAEMTPRKGETTPGARDQPTGRPRGVAVFERVTVSMLPLLWWYRKLEYETLYLTVEPSLQANGWLARAASSDAAIRQLRFPHPVYWGINSATAMALAIVDTVYERHFQHSTLVTSMARLFNSDLVHLAFKKSLLQDLTDHFYHELLHQSAHTRLYPKDDIVVIPAMRRPQSFSTPGLAKYQHVARLVSSDDSKALSLRLPWWVWLIEGLASGLRRLGWAVRAGAVLIWVLSLGLRATFARKQRENYAFGITIVSPRQLTDSHREGDFLLDGSRITRDNTIFIPTVPLSSAAKNWVVNRGMRIGDGVLPSMATVGRIWRHGLALLLWALFAPEWMVQTAVKLLYEFGYWEGFCRRYKLTHLVSHSDFGVRHIARNIVLKAHGTQTWYFTDTVNTSAVYWRDVAGEPYLHHAWTYLYYDHFVSWDESHTGFHRRHAQRVGTYHTVGCLWSEHVRILKESGDLGGLRRCLFPGGLPAGVKVIAVFDSTYDDQVPTTYEDGLEFATGIERLIEDIPDIVCIWKEKKPRAYHVGRTSVPLGAAYDRLVAHPRVRFVDARFGTAEVLALCDLAISFPFTSTTVEGWGAGIRSLYFNPSGKFAGTWYTRIPGAVVHGYEALLMQVRTLLFEVNDEEYRRYLEQCVAKGIGMPLDGFAISRFRDLLCQNSPSRA